MTSPVAPRPTRTAHPAGPAAAATAAESAALPLVTPAQVRDMLLARDELALLDVREEDPYAQAHPLFAAQLSAGRLELDAPWRLPRPSVPVLVFDDGEGLAEPAARRLQALGYSDVRLLDGGLAGWAAAGGELFRDVNVPSKAFGELVEHHRHTPSLPAEQVQALISQGANIVVLDVRRFDEFNTMSIPGGSSCPGAELLLHLRDLAPDPATQVIVNCAGRTRSIIGTQTLVNAGVPNPVAALRNGTIGWTLAGQALAHGETRRFGPVSAASREAAAQAAQALAERSGALRLDAAGLARWRADAHRTLYCWDVRTPEEYEAGHLPGFGNAPGGQLVQETDVFAAVRGARIVLADGGLLTDGTRAAITAHWLAQMGWQVAWLADVQPEHCTETGPWQAACAVLPQAPLLSPAELAAQLNRPGTLLLDFATSAQHLRAHVPGAHWALRAQVGQWLPALALTAHTQLVCTCPDGRLARLAAADIAAALGRPVAALAGGTAAWAAEGRTLMNAEDAELKLLSPRTDRYRRPYEGTSAPRKAMQAYLDWEFGLVAQLGRDGTHQFQVLAV